MTKHIVEENGSIGLMKKATYLDKRQYRKIKTTTIKYTHKFHSSTTHSQVLDAQIWRKWLLQLISFLWVKDTKCERVLGACDLELHNVPALDFHWPCIILPYCSEKEILISWICWGILFEVWGTHRLREYSSIIEYSLLPPVQS